MLVLSVHLLSLSYQTYFYRTIAEVILLNVCILVKQTLSKGFYEKYEHIKGEIRRAINITAKKLPKDEK